MRLGIWCPAPLSIRPDPSVKPAFDAAPMHGPPVIEDLVVEASLAAGATVAA